MKRYLFVIGALALIALPLAAQTGTSKVELSNIFAVTETGQPDPEVTPKCWDKYHELLGQEVVTRFSIDTRTGMESAASLVLGQEVKLYPMGLSNSYSFISDGVPRELSSKGIRQVTFEIDKSFRSPRSSLLATLDKSNNCVINNSYR